MPEQISQAEALEILQRLSQAFQLVDVTLNSEVRGQIWAIYGHAQGEAPTIKSFESIEELGTFINELRTQQNASRELKYYLHILYGQRWKLQKGRVWKIWDGKQLIPLESGDIGEQIDDTGSLLEAVDLDQVLADRAPVEARARVSAVMPAPPIRFEPPDDEEAALSGEDPEVF
jgi:hypothetical protein